MTTRLLRTHDELEAALRVVTGIWGPTAADLAPTTLLRTYSHYGNPVIGAFQGKELCGVSIAFLASAPRVHLHSHVTGVLPTHQHLGIGAELKDTQRRWCLDRGIDLVTWTFDPMLARNAYFNMRKLGAVSHELLPSFYGSMNDDINRDDVTDRLSVEWHLGQGPRHARRVVGEVAIPEDYATLRESDPATATRQRTRVRDALTDAFASGLEIVDFERGVGYLLAPRG